MRLGKRKRTYEVFEQTGTKQAYQERRVGEAIPFSEGYGFTLFLEGDIRLIMYPSGSYSRSNRKFDVFAAFEGESETKNRIHVGHGWKADYNPTYTLRIHDDKAQPPMTFKLKPKVAKKDSADIS